MRRGLPTQFIMMPRLGLHGSERRRREALRLATPPQAATCSPSPTSLLPCDDRPPPSPSSAPPPVLTRAFAHFLLMVRLKDGRCNGLLFGFLVKFEYPNFKFHHQFNRNNPKHNFTPPPPTHTHPNKKTQRCKKLGSTQIEWK